MTKAEIRKRYLQKRADLSEAKYYALNKLLADQFFATVDVSFVKVLHTFIPIPEKREPDTWLIIDRIRREYPHVRLSVPRVNHQKNELEHFYFEGLHQLEKNKWGVLEPKQGIPTPPEKIDMILVPLLAYDKLGHRVGYGKGYYDRFLGRLNHQHKAIGLSFFSPLDQISDVNDRDIQLYSVITADNN